MNIRLLRKVQTYLKREPRRLENDGLGPAVYENVHEGKSGFTAMRYNILYCRDGYPPRKTEKLLKQNNFESWSGKGVEDRLKATLGMIDDFIERNRKAGK